MSKEKQTNNSKGNKSGLLLATFILCIIGIVLTFLSLLSVVAFLCTTKFLKDYISTNPTVLPAGWTVSRLIGIIDNLITPLAISCGYYAYGVTVMIIGLVQSIRARRSGVNFPMAISILLLFSIPYGLVAGILSLVHNTNKNH